MFASEIKALVAFSPNLKEISTQSIVELLYKKYIYSPHTLFEGIRKLQAGCYLRVDSNGIQESKYSGESPSENKNTDPATNIDNIDRLLTESVKICMRSDVDYGLFLSGGIDSSLLLALMNKYSDKPIRTFSVGLNTKFSELRYSRAMSQLFNSQHHEIAITEQDYEDNILKIIRQTLSPVLMPANVPIYILSQEAAKSVKMVLSGETADEIFGGYGQYVYDRLVRWGSLLKPFLKFLPHGKLRRLTELSTIPSLFKRNEAWFANFNSLNKYFQLLNPDIMSALNSSDLFSEPADNSYFNKGTHKLEKMMYYDLKYWLADNLFDRCDKLSMAHSLELRAPYADDELVSSSFKIPIEQKVRHFSGKWILKKVAEKYLPTEIVYRKKQGFTGHSISEMFRKNLRPLLMDTLSAPSSKVYDYVDFKKVNKLIKGHMNQTHDCGATLWTFMNVQLFLQEINA